MITMARWDADPHISPDQIVGQACAVKCSQKRGLKRKTNGTNLSFEGNNKSRAWEENESKVIITIGFGTTETELKRTLISRRRGCIITKPAESKSNHIKGRKKTKQKKTYSGAATQKLKSNTWKSLKGNPNDECHKVFSLSHSSSFIKPENRYRPQPYVEAKRKKTNEETTFKSKSNPITMSSRRSLFVFHKLTMMLDPWQCKRNRSQQTLLPQQESSNTLLVCVAASTARPLLPCLAWTIQLFIHGPWFSVHELNAILDDDYDFQFPVCIFSSVNRHIETGNAKRIDERCNFIIHPFRACGGGLGAEGWHDAVFVCLFLSLACALRTLFVSPIPSHRLFSW